MEYLIQKFALITAIESSENNIDSKAGLKRDLEKEAILCFTMWRKNAGALSDIDIYCICPTRNTISKKTKDVFTTLNVKYIEKYFEITDSFDCGFWNKPLVGSYFEKEFFEKYENIIHIDLDMYLLSPLKDETLRPNACLVYDKIQSLKERLFTPVPSPYNTCFLVTRMKDEIFTKWYTVLSNLPKIGNSFYSEIKRLEVRKLEELAFDLLSLKCDILQIEDIMFGETYTDLGDMTIDSLREIRFHHYHIYESYNQYRWLENIKRLNELKKNFQAK